MKNRESKKLHAPTFTGALNRERPKSIKIKVQLFLHKSLGVRAYEGGAGRE